MKKLIIVLSAIFISLGFASFSFAATDTIVSDTSVTVYGPIDHYVAIDSIDWINPISAVSTWVHPSWPSITGATWISTANLTENPRVDSWRLFSDAIDVPICATKISGTVTSITADNAEEVYLNGILIGTDGEVQGVSIDNQEWSTVLSYPLTGLQAGSNTLKTIVRNYAYATDDPQVNPTGLIYKVDVSYDLLTFYQDSDGDGYGNPQVTMQGCEPERGYVADNTDCDDENLLIHPDAKEICDGIDNDCDGSIDEDLIAPLADNQLGVCSGVLQICDGVNGWIEPDYQNVPYYEVTETRCDTLDNNCDGIVDGEGICEYSCINKLTDTSYRALGLGVNRWVWNGSSWITNKPKGKGPTFTPTLVATHQCGCEQILTWLNDNLPETYGAMNGHWKYGCSQSAIQDFIRLVDDPSVGFNIFRATESLYYNGPSNTYPLYASGPIVIRWDRTSGNVTGGYYTEQVPPYTGAKYYNMITGGTVSNSGLVNLTFTRVNPNTYDFSFNGNLVGNLLSGNLDGPYWFTATGAITP